MENSRIDEVQGQLIRSNVEFILEYLTREDPTPWEKLIANCFQLYMNDVSSERVLIRNALNNERKRSSKLAKEVEESEQRIEELMEDNRNLKCIKTQLLESNAHINNNVSKLLEENKALKKELAAKNEILEDYRKDYYKYSEGLVTQYDTTAAQ